MAKENWQDFGLTPEEKIATLLLTRHGAQPPVNVRNIANAYAEVDEDVFTVSCDAIVIRHPAGRSRPLILLNRGIATREERKRFTIAHEIGHIKIPWHCGTIACDVSEEGPVVSSEHYAFEGDANRFASELLVPTGWTKSVIEDELVIEKIFKRVVSEAHVSQTAARIKLLKILPPGFVCIEYDRLSGIIGRIDESFRGYLDLFINSGDRVKFSRMKDAVRAYIVDEYEISYRQTCVQWFKLDCSMEMPSHEQTVSSASILRGIVEQLFPESREVQNKIIAVLNGHASVANLKDFSKTSSSMFGALKLRFRKKGLITMPREIATVNHPDWEKYLAVKAGELARGDTQRRRPRNRR